jgi:Uma2 family endonuclease
MTPLPKRRYTIEEYIELDKNSEERYEYFNGEVFAMAGGSPDHARISGNIYSTIQQRLRGRNCEAFNSEMRIKVPDALPFRYPDASVVCGEPIFEEILGQQMLVNPVLIVEVLSPSTAAYDLVEKFTAYQSIETFREYLVISQERPHVIQHLRQGHRRWLRIETEGLESELTLESLNVTLPLGEIYERVTFQPPDGLPVG